MNESTSTLVKKKTSFNIEYLDVYEALKLSVINNKWATLVGDSGAGKSSYVKQVLSDFNQYPPFGINGNNWKIIQLSLGINPIISLAKALSDPGQLFPKNAASPNLELKIEKLLREEGTSGLHKILNLAQSTETKSFNLLLVITDFEDLIRYRHLRTSPIDINFISTLVSSIRTKGLPIYILTNITPFYLFETNRYRGLYNISNTGKVTIPNTSIKKIFRNLSTIKIADNAQIEASFIQYLQQNILENFQPNTIIFKINFLIRYYEKIGWNSFGPKQNFSNCIDDYLEDKLIGLPSNLQKPFVYLIKQIVSRNVNGQLERKPMLIEDALSILQHQFGEKIDKSALLSIIHHFQTTELILFHISQGNTYPVIDLYNDALLDSCNKLDEWINEESISRNIFTRLLNETLQYKNGTGIGELYANQKLFAVIEWLEQAKPTPQWAERIEGNTFSDEDKNTWAKAYQSPYEAVLDFITQSKQQYTIKENQEAALKQKQLRKANRIILLVSVLLFISIGAFMIALFYKNQTENEKNKQELLNTFNNLSRAKLLSSEKTDMLKDIQDKIEKSDIFSNEVLFRKIDDNGLFLNNYDEQKNDKKILSLINDYYELSKSNDSINIDKKAKELQKYFKNKDNSPFLHAAMIKYYEALTSSSRKYAKNNTISVYAVASNPYEKNEFAYGDESGTIHISRNYFSNKIESLDGGYGIRSLAYTDTIISNGKQFLFAGNQQGQLYRWILRENGKERPFNLIKATKPLIDKFPKSIENLAFLENQSSKKPFLVIGTSNKLYIRNILTKKTDLLVASKEPIVSWSVESIPNKGSYLFYSTPSYSRLMDVSTIKKLQRYPKIKHPINTVITASTINNSERNPKLVLGSSIGKIWYMNILELVEALKYSTDSNFDKLSNAGILTEYKNRQQQNAAISNLVFNPFEESSQLASASLDGTILLFDVPINNDGNIKNELKLTENTRDIWTLAFVNETEIVAGENRVMKIWITDTDTLYENLKLELCKKDPDNNFCE